MLTVIWNLQETKCKMMETKQTWQNCSSLKTRWTLNFTYDLTAWGVVIHSEITSHQAFFLQKSQKCRCWHGKGGLWVTPAPVLAALCTRAYWIGAFQILWVPKAIGSFQNKRKVNQQIAEHILGARSILLLTLPVLHVNNEELLF